MECVGEGGREGWANEVVYVSLESMAFSDFVVWIILCDDCSFIADD
jgi:hypothetical protein